jgi:phytoene desaturase
MSQQTEAPVVIIGGGLAGLAAALTLTRAGLPVVVLEASDGVGGCCSTARVSGFTFNNGAVYVAVPSLLRASFQRLGLDLDAEVPLTPIERPHETHLDDGTVVRLSDAAGSSVEGPQAAQRTAMLREGLEALQRRWGPVYRTLVEDVLPFKPSLPRTLGKIWRYLPRMAGNADRLIATHFPDPGLQAAVASLLLYTGTAPEQLPATQIIGLLALLEEGFHLPRGGMGAITDALRRALQQKAVPLRLGARVDSIEVQHGRVSGVTLMNGERLATRHVIATCSGFEVVERLLSRDAVPARMARRARNAPLSHRAIAIQLGVSGIGAGGAFIVNHVPLMPQQGQMHVAKPGMPRWMTYTHPTSVLSELAPQGKGIIEFYAPVSGINTISEWTRDMTERSVAVHMQALALRLPGLKIDARRVIDPKDFALSRHLYEGALYGIAPGVTPDKFFPHRTPVHGLYLAGQTTFPGYGVPSATLSGIQAADALIRDWGT